MTSWLVMDSADDYSPSLPFSWHEFGVIKDVFLSEEPDLMKPLTALSLPTK